MNQVYTQKDIPPLFKATEEARLVVVGFKLLVVKLKQVVCFGMIPVVIVLREWLGITRDQCNNSPYIAHLPMDFLLPRKKAITGDLPPRKGFAEKWHLPLLATMPQVETILLVGNYAQQYYLAEKRKRNLSETVRNYNPVFT